MKIKNVVFFLLGALVAVILLTVVQNRPQSYTVKAQGRLLPEEEAVTKIAHDLLPSVVSITTAGVIQRESWFGTVQQREEGQGSGVIVRPDGYILTNRHVISLQGALQQSVTVVLPNGKVYKNARVVDSDPRTDLAVVKIPATGLSPVPLGDSNQILVGQMAIAVGNPLGLTQTVTQGIISAKGRSIEGDNGQLEGLLQTDAPINPGNSGGALVDSSGRLMGINTAIAQLGGGGNIGIGFAVPVNVAKKVLDDIARYGRIRIPWVGLEFAEVPPAWQDAYGLPAGVIVRPVPGSPAAQAGIQSYDVITQADGKPVRTTQDLQSILNKKNIGDTVNLRIVRDGKTLNVTVRLQEQPRNGGI